MTLSINDATFRKMKLFSEIKWSEVARRAIEGKILLLEELEKIASKSRLTAKDADAISKKIKAGIARKYATT